MQQDHIVAPHDDVTRAIVEPHTMDAGTQTFECLFLGEPMRLYLDVQQLRDPDRRLHERTELVEAVIDHPLVHDRGGERDGSDQRHGGQSHKQRQLGAQPEPT